MPLLTGLTADGVEVPVQVEPDGVLVAEGIQGPPGPQGPEGPQGPQGPKGDPGSGGSLPFGTYAWADTAADGTLNGSNGLFCNKSAPGTYDYTFNTPLPDANYGLVASTTDGPATIASSNSKTTTGFQVFTTTRTDGTPTTDQSHSVVVTAALT